jgi:hydrogenase maturation protease
MSVDFCTQTASCWIIAYGNPQRGDDGIGPYVAQCLERRIGELPSVNIFVAPQLDLALLEEIQCADHVIFVDASVEQVEGGVRWTQATPELNGWALGSHHIDPKTFLGLLDLLYDARPIAWVVTVQGRNFDLCETLDPQTRNDAEQAAVQIVDWLFMHSIAIPFHQTKANHKSY